MKTPEEIKKGLECCTAPMLAHDSCPYKADRNPFEVICKDRVMEDALAYIRELEAQLAQVKAERDRYWEYIKGLGCDTCGGDCDRCEVGLDRVWSGWVWAGEKEEKRP